jgi:glyoxylase-like metal-dependent hydrolase (beta-lactamase superfamily II)
MGPVIITPLNIGILRFDLTYIYSLPADHPSSGKIAEVPMFCYHISIPGRSLLVDAVAYDPEQITEPYQISGYKPPPPLIEQLSAHSIEAEQVSDVIITHTHTDHYGALCREVDGQNQLAFPKAQHYLSVADWQPEIFEKLEQRTLRLVAQKGLLNLTEGVVDLGDGLVILPMPGETPGHQILYIGDDEEGQNFYFAGDLYHHQIELSDETINPQWVDLKEMQASKAALKKRIANDGGIVYFTHIPGSFCVVEGELGQLVWQEL